MRKLVAGTFLTLDGVMQAPGGPDEDREGGFRHGGWLVPYFDEKFVEIMTGWTRRADSFLLGRKTYEIFAASWPKSTDPADEAATALNTRPKFVASRTLDRVDWNNSRLLKGDVAAQVAGLKAEGDGEIQVHGSGDLLQTLLRNSTDHENRTWRLAWYPFTRLELHMNSIRHVQHHTAQLIERLRSAGVTGVEWVSGAEAV